MLQEPPIKTEGQSCDARTALNRCENGTLCLANGNRNTCQEPSASCPAAWTVASLNACTTETTNRFLCMGDLSTATVETTSTCQIDERQILKAVPYKFVAPVAGKWHFETSGTDIAGDTLLFARQFCSYTQPDAELTCNDDIVHLSNSWSAINLDLEENQEIYIFVSNIGGFNDWKGSFALEVQLR